MQLKLIFQYLPLSVSQSVIQCSIVSDFLSLSLYIYYLVYIPSWLPTSLLLSGATSSAAGDGAYRGSSSHPHLGLPCPRHTGAPARHGDGRHYPSSPRHPIYFICLSYVQEEQAEEEEGQGGRGEARLNYDEFIISRRLTIMMLMLMLMLVMTMMMTKIQHSSNTR